MSTAAPMGVDWSAPVGDAVSSGIAYLADGWPYMAAVMVCWIGYEVTRKVIDAIAGKRDLAAYQAAGRRGYSS